MSAYITHWVSEQDPSIADTIEIGGTAQDLSAVQSVLLKIRQSGTALWSSGTATLVNGGTAGSVLYNFGTADVSGWGEKNAWWFVTYGDGKTQSTPEFVISFQQHRTDGVGQNFTNVRETMADLIALTRRKIGDFNGPNEQFSDAEVQQALDQYRQIEHPRGYYGGGYGPTWRYEQLIPTPVYAPGGTIEYLQYQSRENYWEMDATVTDSTYTPITPTSVDFLSGVWIFPAGTSTVAVGQVPPVYALGKTFDLWRSCSDLLFEWSAQMALQMDFQMGQDSVKLSQKTMRLEQLAYRYLAKAKPQTMTLERSDLLPQPNVAHRRFRRYLRGDWGGV